MQNALISGALYAALCANGWAQTLHSEDDPSPSLDLTIVNLGEGDGPVKIAIDTEETWFVKGAEPVYSFTVVPNGGSAVLHVESLAPGAYALRVFHDEDDDGELGTNFLGVPNEPYGFSGKKTNRLRPRSFEYARFEFDKSMEMTIKLR